MGNNSYCKNDYSQSEVNVVETAETRLQKTKNNVSMVSFYCLASKMERNTILY